MVSRINRGGFVRFVAFGVFLCLCSAFCGVPAVDATLVWSDTFDTGTLPGDWTVLEGSFTCANNRLETQTANWHAAYTPSTVGALGTEGEWRFDVHYETAAGMWVAFMAEDINGVGGDRPDDGYGIFVSRYDGVIRLIRHVSGTESYMGYYSMTTSDDYSIIVTRNSTGTFNVFVDGTFRFSATNTDVTTSAYFLVVIFDPGNYIDNIYVYDEILTEPANGGENGELPPPPVPGFPALAIAVGVVGALTISVIYRRRQSLAQPQ